MIVAHNCFDSLIHVVSVIVSVLWWTNATLSQQYKNMVSNFCSTSLPMPTNAPAAPLSERGRRRPHLNLRAAPVAARAVRCKMCAEFRTWRSTFRGTTECVPRVRSTVSETLCSGCEVVALSMQQGQGSARNTYAVTTRRLQSALS